MCLLAAAVVGPEEESFDHAQDGEAHQEHQQHEHEKHDEQELEHIFNAFYSVTTK